MTIPASPTPAASSPEPASEEKPPAAAPVQKSPPLISQTGFSLQAIYCFRKKSFPILVHFYFLITQTSVQLADTGGRPCIF